MIYVLPSVRIKRASRRPPLIDVKEDDAGPNGFRTKLRKNQPSRVPPTADELAATLADPFRYENDLGPLRWAVIDPSLRLSMLAFVEDVKRAVGEHKGRGLGGKQSRKWDRNAVLAFDDAMLKKGVTSRRERNEAIQRRFRRDGEAIALSTIREYRRNR